MPDFFTAARNIVVWDGWFVASEVTNYNFNLILFAKRGESPPNKIAQTKQAEDRAHTPSIATHSRQQLVLCGNWLIAPLGVVSGAVLVNWIVNATDRKIPPSGPPPLLPPVLSIYGRDEFIQRAVGKILLSSEVKKHIALRGGPGMGKTAIATGIVHHPRIARYFGSARHWVDCREASDIADELKASKLLEYVSDSLNLDLTASSNRRRNIRYFFDNNDVPRIIVLDNFETMWEPPSAQKPSERVLGFLAQFTQLTILLTTRNAHTPAIDCGVSWHQLELIQPLSLDASRMLFTSLSPPESIDGHLDDLLRAIDCIPLPIVLMASSAQENYTTLMILERWNNGLSKHSDIQPHKDDGNPMNKLDHSISISLEGPFIKSRQDTPVLLRIIAGLPGGIGRKNLQRIVPLIHDVDQVADVLIRTSLLMNSPDALQMHSTIRSYMLRNWALDTSHQENVQAYYFQLIHEAGGDPGTPDFLKHAQSLSQEETNAVTILLIALEHNLSTSVSISMDYANYLLWNVPSTDVPKKTVELIRKEPFRGAGSWLPLALLRLGTLHYRIDEYAKATKVLLEAANLYKKLDQLSWAAQAWFQLAGIARIHGEHAQALKLYSEAYKQFKDVGDTHHMADCLSGKGMVYFEDKDFLEAVEAIRTAQKTCTPEDHTCIADCRRELGRVYRYHNQTESIRQSTMARNYYLIHGPQRYAPFALYHKSIALYWQGDYDEADAGLKEAFEEFKSLRNDGQMAYCVYHRAEMNHLRGSHHQALALYHQSETMFEHIENKFWVGMSLKRQAELYSKLCQPDKARQANSSAYDILENFDARDASAMNNKKNIHDLCELAISPARAFKLLLLFLACMVLCLLLIHRPWHQKKRKELQDSSLVPGYQK